MRIVVSGYHGMGNTGDEAVLASFLQGLDELLPEAEVVVLSGDPGATERVYRVHAVPRMRLDSIARAIRGSDLLVSGGGSLLQDVTGWRSVPYYTGIMGMAGAMGVPVSVYAQGLGPLRSGLSRLLVRAALKRASVISLRDAESMALLQSIGVAGPGAHLVADPAFALTPLDSNHARRIAQYQDAVVFALRPWDVGRDVTQEYADCARKVRAELGADVVFAAFQPSSDWPMVQRIASLCSATAVNLDMHPREALGVIAKAQLVVGMRLHALIFAASVGVPAVAIEYDPKVRALCERVGTTHVLPAGVDGGTLYETIARAWSVRERLKAEQALAVDELRAGARRATRLALEPILGKESVVCAR